MASWNVSTGTEDASRRQDIRECVRKRSEFGATAPVEAQAMEVVEFIKGAGMD